MVLCPSTLILHHFTLLYFTLYLINPFLIHQKTFVMQNLSVLCRCYHISGELDGKNTELFQKHATWINPLTHTDDHSAYRNPCFCFFKDFSREKSSFQGHPENPKINCSTTNVYHATIQAKNIYSCFSVHVCVSYIYTMFTVTTHSLRRSAYPHQPCVDTLYALPPCRHRPKLVLTSTSIPLYLIYSKLNSCHVIMPCKQCKNKEI